MFKLVNNKQDSNANPSELGIRNKSKRPSRSLQIVSSSFYTLKMMDLKALTQRKREREKKPHYPLAAAGPLHCERFPGKPHIFINGISLTPTL